ncbi:hypothetical protein AMTR_s00046p00064910 [Amborella trichopoda]|uniref:DDE Tnp4 domain-containing protein n=2 Tax=Amborella trichopoda TaxID=13333 RepID=U5D939_AMBTC|nr:hypothetical protein AMTR_s00046p00064910 [Amborella trichopoda]
MAAIAVASKSVSGTPKSPNSKRKRLQLEPEQTSVETGLTPNPLNTASFQLFFRMNASTFEWLVGMLEPLLECRDPVGSPLNLAAPSRLGIGLFRLATGSSYKHISARFGVPESTARFCSKQLCRVLCTNFRFWVAFPAPSELNPVMVDFEAIGGLPHCCGAIDSTRFKLLTKSNSPIRSSADKDVGSEIEEEEEEDSVVAQIVVDSWSRILSIITGFHGDKGDARVLRSSTLYKDVEEGKLMNLPPRYLKGVPIPQYLVGDNGYPLLPWLMIPYTEPVASSCEEDFNAIHELMRRPALRTLASLRNWGILARPIDEEFKMGVACIGACAILHNVLLMREDYTSLSDDYSLHDQSSQYYRDASIEECFIERKASVVRRALAGRVREARNSSQSAS